MTINEQARADWLSALTAGAPLQIRFLVGPYTPEYSQGDVIGVVTALPGAGLVGDDDLEDRPSFQIQLTGRDRDQQDMADTMGVLDQALIRGSYPAQLWGVQVRYIDRTGSGPSPVQEDEHQRLSYACTYLAGIVL